MKNAVVNLRHSLEQLLLSLSQSTSYFSIERVREALAAKRVEISDGLLREYLSDAMAKGVVHDAGRGWYSRIAESAVLDAAPIQGLRKLLREWFPFLPHYAWSTLQLNPWMHHLIGKPLAVVTVDRDDVDDVAAFLDDEGWRVHVNPTAKSEVRPGDRSVVIRGIRREFDPEVEPRVETILVDLFLENGKIAVMDEAERQAMTRNLITNHCVDITHVLSRLTDHKRSFEELCGTVEEPIISEKQQNSEMIGWTAYRPSFIQPALRKRTCASRARPCAAATTRTWRSASWPWSWSGAFRKAGYTSFSKAVPLWYYCSIRFADCPLTSTSSAWQPSPPN